MGSRERTIFSKELPRTATVISISDTGVDDK